MYQTSIPGYKGYYEINTAGQVISLERLKGNTFNTMMPYKVLIPLNREGYEYVSLHKNGTILNISVHRLMCLTFLPNPENKKYVNHLDGIRNNNPLWNVEWATPSENAQHAHDTGLQVSAKGKDHYSARAVLQITKDGKLVERHDTLVGAAKSINKHPAHIGRVAKGERKYAYGFKWEYV